MFRDSKYNNICLLFVAAGGKLANGCCLIVVNDIKCWWLMAWAEILENWSQDIGNTNSFVCITAHILNPKSYYIPSDRLFIHFQVFCNPISNRFIKSYTTVSLHFQLDSGWRPFTGKSSLCTIGLVDIHYGNGSFRKAVFFQKDLIAWWYLYIYPQLSSTRTVVLLLGVCRTQPSKVPFSDSEFCKNINSDEGEVNHFIEYI